jgi:tRNA(Ile)-lysidine synthase
VERRFKEHLKELTSVDSDSHTILAVSGGIDSVVMAYLFKASTYSFSIAHCNFQLRGEESDKDEDFVEKYAEKLGVEIFIEKFDTETYAKERGLSIQMAARNLRYQWFKNLAKNSKAKIATAHHANDVAETMLFNLTKGTGIAGLHGITKEDGVLIRPMLWVEKEEIEAYAGVKGIDWREDQSNESEKYMRNIIRKKVIPELERVNPSFIEGALRSTSRVKAAEDFIQYMVDQLDLIEERDNAVYINVAALKRIPGFSAVLYLLIKPYGFNYDQVGSIEKSIEKSGAIFKSGEWTLNIDRDQIIISKQKEIEIDIIIEKDDENIDLKSGRLEIEIFSSKDYVLNESPAIGALDYDKLTFPLQLRSWRQADRFAPLGMKGEKKISDFLIDAKIPVAEKSNILVLLSGEKIAWLVGFRVNDKFKITPNTNTIYQICLA